MTAVIYARYSSSTQTELSIQGQLKVCREYAERNGFTVAGEYIDRAISGKAANNRPDFRRMMDDSARGGFGTVLVYQLDRFARNRLDSALYKAHLRLNGVRVISARETISDDASGILMEALLEGIAEYYIIELSQKVRRGLEINAAKGLYTGASVPTGYTIENKRFIIDVSTAPIIKRIFDMYLSGQGITEIARNLGKPYNRNSVRRILTNRRYTGVYKYGSMEIPDAIPRLIDDETFYRAQSIMEDNKNKNPARKV
ncbi:MAG: recombinase family protein [Defluviitaleaceae bacterium]|nr:recombinase family protein [Defluviitaleaceae bacterium]